LLEKKVFICILYGRYEEKPSRRTCDGCTGVSIFIFCLKKAAEAEIAEMPLLGS
jgi:hypothetical protein